MESEAEAAELLAMQTGIEASEALRLVASLRRAPAPAAGDLGSWLKLAAVRAVQIEHIRLTPAC